MNAGYWMLLTACCILPLIAFGLGIVAHRIYQRRGLGGFIPRIRTEGLRHE